MLTLKWPKSSDLTLIANVGCSCVSIQAKMFLSSGCVFFFLFQEELQSVVHQLTGELSQLTTAHKRQMLELQEKLSSQSCSQTPNTQEELTECRRSSCGDIQQYLQAGLKTLEDRCGAQLPILTTIARSLQAMNRNGLVANVPGLNPFW